jgi:uncharacterized repeat protein (TIGR01451 family)
VIRQEAETWSVACPEPVASNTTLTAVVPPVLRLIKRADRSTATVGDGVVYSIVVQHRGIDPDLTEVTLVDLLPEVLRFVPGSVRIDGAPGPDPTIDPTGSVLRLPLGPMEPGETRQVTLAALVMPTAREGEALNSARAEAITAGGAPLLSNLSTVSVGIYPGPFRREAYLVGRVFVDDNVNGRPDEGEPGVPGVLVMLEDGRGSITDITGRWHIEAVRPGRHVIRIDPSTLPATLMPASAGMEWAGDRATRFVEARAAELVVTHMPVGPPGAPRCTVTGGHRRLDLPLASLHGAAGPLPGAEGHLDAVARWLEDAGPPGAIVRAECGALDRPDPGASSAIVERIDALVAERMKRDDPPVGETRVDARDPPAPDESDGLAELLRSAEPTAAIVSPRDGTLAERSRVTVEVVYPATSTPQLLVNGEPVSHSRVGTTVVLPSRGVAAARYLGVELREGRNRLDFRALPPGVPPDAELTPVTSWVYVPGRPVELRVSVPEEHWVADGVTPGRLRIEAVDGSGVRTSARLVVTVDADNAQPVTPDLDPEEPGHQARLVGGEVVVRFAPRTLPGRIRLAVWTDEMEIERFIEVRPGGGAWRVFGMVEGQLAGEGGVAGDGGLPPGFEDEITGDGGRVAVFARGPVGDASRVTVSLDTARERNESHLTDTFAPDAFYPVPGDTSIRTNEAATQGKLFARVDGPRGFAQWGDFATGFERVDLARYDRRMTGASGRFVADGLAVEAFASSSEQQVVRDEFEADGTSGPFLLSRTPVVARSEKVFVELRDQFQTEKVLSREVKRRDIDYSLDAISGTILFNGAVAAFDPNLNLYRVVVLYETLSGGKDQLTFGTRLSVQAAPKLQAGASAVTEGREGSDLNLYGVDLSWRPAPGTVVNGEVATSDVEAAATAVALEVRSRPRPQLEWSVDYLDLPADYANPTYLGSPELGTERYGGRIQWQPRDVWRLRGETFVQKDKVNSFDRFVADLFAERSFGALTAIGGLRSVATSSPAGEIDSTLLTGGLRGRLAERWVGELIREQALGEETAPGYPTRTTVGLGYKVVEGTRLFLRRQFESGDGTTVDRTLVGVESQVGRRTRAEMSYAMDGGANGTTVRALTGIDTVLPIGSKSSVNLTASGAKTSRGDESRDLFSLAGGYEYRSGVYVLSSRYEVRFGDENDLHLLTVAGTFHPDEAWTFYVRERLSIDDAKSTGTAWRAEGLFGVAFRPLAGRWRFLARVDNSNADGVVSSANGILPGTAISQPTSSIRPPEPEPVSPGLGFGPGRQFQVDTFSASIAAGARLTARQRLGASFVVRRVGGDREHGLPSTLARLVSLHYTVQVAERWTVGASLRRFGERETERDSYGQGIEISFLLLRNLWLTSGYNFTGVDDDLFPLNERTDEGPFVSLRFKFDETSVTRWSDLRLDR